ncbi:MAG: hypothetical protein ACI8VW_003589 [bacterium]|jgi:hypothetical protein
MEYSVSAYSTDTEKFDERIERLMAVHSPNELQL